jgi:hypothetical protein
MDSCGCDDYATPIDTGTAQADRASYRAKGPDRTTRMLLDMIEANTEDRATLLDVGGGIGVIDHELLRTRSITSVPGGSVRGGTGGRTARSDRDHRR